MRITEEQYFKALEVIKSYKDQIEIETMFLNETEINYLTAKKGDYIVFNKVNLCRKDIVLGEKYLITNVKVSNWDISYRCIVIKIDNKTRYFHFRKNKDTNEALFIKNPL